ncbi:MAG TPA: hypothetical protein ENK52_01030 [Saprospiraceae bacterium]|nr:hypothetical protein [Saprospiraceae bacterium]
MVVVRPFSITEINLPEANVSKYGTYKVILLDDESEDELLYFGFIDEDARLFFVSEDDCKLVIEIEL